MKTILKNLGASDKESEIFFKMLVLGPQPASVIAKHMTIPRSTAYAILERLKKMNLIEEFQRNGITFFKCIPAKSLEDILILKSREISESQKLLQQELPKLIAMENRTRIAPKVIFLEGKEKVKKMYEEIIKENEFLAAFNPKLVKKLMPEYFYKLGDKLKEKNGKAKEILSDCDEAREYKNRFNSENHEIKILKPEVKFAADIIICSDKIFMISYGETELCATEIINTSLAHTQKVLFKQLWNKI